MRRRWGWMAILPVLGVGIGAMVPLGARATVVGEDVNLPNPSVELAEAQAAAPYRIREPAFLPADTKLVLVTWVPPALDEGESAFSVDLWYGLPDGTRLHLWQTDAKYLAEAGKDPAAPTEGEPVNINGDNWRLVRLEAERGTALSRRFADGITLSLDARLDDASLQQIAASIS